MRITSYGIREIGIAFVLLGVPAGVAIHAGLAGGSWLGWLALPPLAVFVWVLSFFRDPERTVPSEPGLLVSPADGRVTHVDEVDEPLFLGGRALRVSIFMSIFNVHVNRAPCDGVVVHKSHRPGAFLNAGHSDSMHRNEAGDMGLETGDARMPRVLVRQIAGLIARRIVCDREVGARLQRGERFGMIKFSSRLEVYVSAAAGVRARVAPGDIVRAGETVIGELP